MLRVTHTTLVVAAIPLADPKSQPEIYFYEVVEQANSIFHLFEKQFSDSLVPAIRYCYVVCCVLCTEPPFFTIEELIQEK